MTRCLAMLVVSLAAAVPATRAQDPSVASQSVVSDVARRLRAYLIGYETRMGALVAEERFEQLIW